MLQGLWSSESFMKYIRIQIQQFSTEISSVMVENEFFTITDSDLRIHYEDPETSMTGNLSASSPLF